MDITFTTTHASLGRTLSNKCFVSPTHDDLIFKGPGNKYINFSFSLRANDNMENSRNVFSSISMFKYSSWNVILFSIQWNPYIADTIGELHVGRYRGPAVAEGFYKY